ncbi:hypothetical protein PIB30_049472 [Stylosanthes scabra]|uniref:Mitochondrial import inner membrane translocase subunit TIM50 n=1 Tax=Stylosanthes scabra TaxID=79078 RepID=A0ABU6ZG78_9FABA|nr:hypothetical protein [Stylosanthes scabra]
MEPLAVAEESNIIIPTSKFGCLKRKLIVLDINGVLAHLIFPAPPHHNADALIQGEAIYKRPFYLEFLKFCFENFEVGIWSSRSKKYVDPIVDYLLGDMRNKLLFCWDDSHCVETSFKSVEDKKKPLLFKDLRKIWNKHDPNLPWEKGYYNESNTLLIDDSPHKGLLNPPHTSIFPHTFTCWNKSDNSLGVGGEMYEHISRLANVENVQKYIKEHPFGQAPITQASPSWNFYVQVLATLSAAYQSQE